MSFAAATGLRIETTKGGPNLVGRDHPPKMIRLGVDGADLPALCDRVRVQLDDGHPDVVVFEVGALISPDLRTIDALARARLIARRDGCELFLANASAELRELLELAGLAEAVPCEEGSALDTKRESEGGEESRGVEEEGDPADAVT